jgi:hypothetical protein
LFSAIRHRKLHLARSVGFKTERYNQAVSYDSTKRLRRLFSAIRHRKLRLARSVGFKTERYNQAVSYDIKKNAFASARAISLLA